MKLWNLPNNEIATIKSISASEKYSHRLRELGISEGRSITCIRRAPFGGPGVYQLNNCVFSLESSLAQAIEVDKQ